MRIRRKVAARDETELVGGGEGANVTPAGDGAGGADGTETELVGGGEGANVTPAGDGAGGADGTDPAGGGGVVLLTEDFWTLTANFCPAGQCDAKVQMK